MAEKCYGDKTRSYVVTERKRHANGRIEVFVFHENETFQKILKNHADNPIWFLERYEAYLRSEIMAKRWLAHVMEDYETEFKENLVDFTFITFR